MAIIDPTSAISWQEAAAIGGSNDNNLQAQISGAISGAPVSTQTASVMTDHTKNYWYLGSESGYTHGNIYSWNGSQFADSGAAYPGAAIADKSVALRNLSDGIAIPSALKTFWELGTVSGTDGSLIDATTRIRTTNKLYANSGATISLNSDGTYEFAITIFGATENGSYSFVSQTGWMISPYTVPSDCRVQAMIRKHDNSDLAGETSAGNLLSIVPYQTSIDILNSDLQARIGGYPSYAWELGTVSGTDGSLMSSNTRVRMVQKRFFPAGTVIFPTDCGNYMLSVALYSAASSGAIFVSQTPWSSAPYVLQSDAYILVMVKKYDESDLTGKESETGSVAQIDVPSVQYITPAKFSSQSVNASSLSRDLQAKVGSPKLFHLSFDDTITLFEDLTSNASTYTSIFQNSTLAYFKYLHDNLGVCISCYCFYADGSFNLSSVPAQYAKEFQVNADWLKFGFHAQDASTNFVSTDSATAKSQYDTVIAQFMRIFGSYYPIDRCPRLANFAGNLVSVQAIRDTQCGILGLLTADDTRQSYYLDASSTNLLMQNRDRIYDAANYLTLFKTDLRMENVSDMSSQLTSLDTVSWANLSTDLVVFTHEWQLPNSGIKPKIEQCCRWAYSRGYRFGFPMDILYK